MRQQRQPRELDLGDYLAIVKRRALWIIVPSVIATILGISASFVVPARYTSQALVLIEQQKVPGDFVRSVVNQDLNARLMSMAEKIFSRTRLQPLIERLGLYSDKNISIDEKIDQLRSDIVVTPARSDLAKEKGAPGFVISANASQPRAAQQLCGEIASMFLSENLRLREQSAEGTTEFLQSQLDDAKRALDEQEANLAAFQKQYLGQLPEQEQANANMLLSLNSQLEASTQALSRMEIDKSYVETMLAQQTALAEAAQAGGDAPPPPEIETKIEQTQAELTALEARYTPDHPDVVKTRRELESLKKEQLQAAPALPPFFAPAAKPELDPSKAAELRAQLQVTKGRIAAQKADQGRIQAQIKNYQARLQFSPQVQERYRQLSRGYETAQRFYDDLLVKKNQSTMATELERREEGEQFRLIDPPNYPEKPAFPNRLLFSISGLAAGLCLGGGLAAFAEYRDKTLCSEADVLRFTNLETLAMVPVIFSAKPRKTKGRRLASRKKRPMLAKAGAGGRG